MFLNDDIVDIEKPDGICSQKFIVDELPELILHPSIFSIKHSRCVYIASGALSDFWYWLSFNILVSSEDKILYFHVTFLWDLCLFSVAKQ